MEGQVGTWEDGVYTSHDIPGYRAPSGPGKITHTRVYTGPVRHIKYDENDHVEIYDEGIWVKGLVTEIWEGNVEVKFIRVYREHGIWKEQQGFMNVHNHEVDKKLRYPLGKALASTRHQENTDPFTKYHGPKHGPTGTRFDV